MMRAWHFLFGIEVMNRRWMALLVTFTVAHACTIKGIAYLQQYPGWLGWALLALTPLTPMIVGVNLMALVRRNGSPELR